MALVLVAEHSAHGVVELAKYPLIADMQKPTVFTASATQIDCEATEAAIVAKLLRWC